MRTARPLGLSPDGTSLIVVIDGGEQVAIPADERLRAALRNDRVRMGQLEIEMESALRPRDIQARIRAGESLEAVALAAGVPQQQIEPFAAPVIAEREHIAGLAQTNPVRRAGDAVAHRGLRAVVTDRLLSRGVDVDSVDWDAWRNEDRRWTIRLAYESGSAQRQADFTYDQTGRFSVAANDDARWLTGEQSTSHGPQPGRRPRSDDSDAERTANLNDELAIVRAIQPQFAVTPDIDDEYDLLDDDEASSGEDGTPDNEDAFAEGDLAEVDGVYDIIPGDRSSLDVLYDMLSSFDEDSVQIYAGLVRPAPDQDAAPVLDNRPAPMHAVEDRAANVTAVEPADRSAEADEDEGEPTAALEFDDEAEGPTEDAALEDGESDDDESDDEDAIFADLATPRSPAAAEPFEEETDPATKTEDDEDAIFADVATPHSSAADEPFEDEEDAAEADAVTVVIDPRPSDDAPAEATTQTEAAVAEQPESAAPPRRPTGRKRPVVQPSTEPEQPSLVDEAANEPSRPIKRKRASVPSWDEIVFGSPKPKQ